MDSPRLFRRPLHTDGAVMVPVIFGAVGLVYIGVQTANGDRSGGELAAAYLLTLAMVLLNGTILAFVIAYLRQSLRRLLARR